MKNQRSRSLGGGEAEEEISDYIDDEEDYDTGRYRSCDSGPNSCRSVESASSSAPGRKRAGSSFSFDGFYSGGGGVSNGSNARSSLADVIKQKSAVIKLKGSQISNSVGGLLFSSAASGSVVADPTLKQTRAPAGSEKNRVSLSARGASLTAEKERAAGEAERAASASRGPFKFVSRLLSGYHSDVDISSPSSDDNSIFSKRIKGYGKKKKTKTKADREGGALPTAERAADVHNSDDDDDDDTHFYEAGVTETWGAGAEGKQQYDRRAPHGGIKSSHVWQQQLAKEKASANEAGRSPATAAASGPQRLATMPQPPRVPTTRAHNTPASSRSMQAVASSSATSSAAPTPLGGERTLAVANGIPLTIPTRAPRKGTARPLLSATTPSPAADPSPVSSSSISAGVPSTVPSPNTEAPSRGLTAAAGAAASTIKTTTENSTRSVAEGGSGGGGGASLPSASASMISTSGAPNGGSGQPSNDRPTTDTDSNSIAGGAPQTLPPLFTSTGTGSVSHLPLPKMSPPSAVVLLTVEGCGHHDLEFRRGRHL